MGHVLFRIHKNGGKYVIHNKKQNELFKQPNIVKEIKRTKSELAYHD